MATSTEIHPRRKTARKMGAIHTSKKDSKLSTKSLICLWSAFHSLNRTAAKLNGTSGDLQETTNHVIHEGKRIYHASLVSFENNNYKMALELSHSVLDLCHVMDALIDNEIQNLLDLHSPPSLVEMHQQGQRKSGSTLHPGLRALHSLLIHRPLMPNYDEKDFPKKAELVLLKVSKCLSKLEQAH